MIGDASDHFFLQERDLAVGAQQPAGHGNTQSLAKVSSEPKHSGSKGQLVDVGRHSSVQCM